MIVIHLLAALFVLLLSIIQGIGSAAAQERRVVMLNDHDPL